MKEILKAFGIDTIIGLDWETYWADKYTLSDKSRGTTEYIHDERFESQLIAVQDMKWDKPRVMEVAEFRRWAATINWARVGVLAHHGQFDGYIAMRHFGIAPKAYFCTMAMARAVLPIYVGASLDRVAKSLGLKGKRYGAALTATKNKRWKDFTKEEKANLKLYAGDDISDTWAIFRKLIDYFPIEELKLMDMTVAMYAQPRLLVDKMAIEAVYHHEIERKQALVADVVSMLKLKDGRNKPLSYDAAKKHLTSKDKFSVLLREQGIEPPTKVSKKQSAKASAEAGYDVEVEVLAMSKQDQEFKDLMGHPNKKVRKLIEARFAVSSNLLENRCLLLAARSVYGPQPVYLNTYGAKTLRWSGGDNANWQNLSSKRREGGAELRASVHAPPGHSLIIADLAQIEARIAMWFAGQMNIVEVFRAYDTIERWEPNEKGILVPVRAGPDVYRYTAAHSVYNKPIEKITDGERFIGKTCVLALVFQAGWKRFAATLRIGAFGPPVDITDTQARDIHSAWRSGHKFVQNDWKKTQNLVKSAFIGQQELEHRVVSYKGAMTKSGLTGWMKLPGGMAIRYDDIQFDENGLEYCSKYQYNKVADPTIEYTRLYGGIEVENRTQALARNVIAMMMVGIRDELKDKGRIAMSTHDEVVVVVKDSFAKKALAIVTEIMSQPPDWAPDLPIAVDAHISKRYDK